MIQREPILQVKDLHYIYNGDKKVLKGVSLDIYQGEKIAVLGSNGAGKSTFFLNINGVLKSKQGEIIYRGEKIQKKNLNHLRKNVGIVFQNSDNQIIASTVKAEVSFGPMNLKLPKDEVIRRVDKALDYMNISDFRERPPHYLSGGEKKRVSIADIIAMESEIVIFDEPTAALDPLNVTILEEVLEKMGNDGQTMLISTHDVDFAYRWADRIVVFCDGRIIADDTPIRVFQQEDILKRANLKHPTMLDIYNILKEKDLVSDLNLYPKSVEELKEMLNKEEEKCVKNNILQEKDLVSDLDLYPKSVEELKEMIDKEEEKCVKRKCC